MFGDVADATATTDAAGAAGDDETVEGSEYMDAAETSSAPPAVEVSGVGTDSGVVAGDTGESSSTMLGGCAPANDFGDFGEFGGDAAAAAAAAPAQVVNAAGVNVDPGLIEESVPMPALEPEPEPDLVADPESEHEVDVQIEADRLIGSGFALTVSFQFSHSVPFCAVCHLTRRLDLLRGETQRRRDSGSTSQRHGVFP